MNFFKSIYFVGILAFLLTCVGTLLVNNDIDWGIYVSYTGVAIFAVLFIKLCLSIRK